MSEMTMKRCGVLFDLDGVLLDSEGLYTIFWEQIDKEYPTGIDEFASYIKGSHLARIMGYFDNEEVRRDILNKLNDYERNMRYEFFPGALEFVRHLQEAGIRMAIVTSSDRKKMLSLYRQYPEFHTLFDQIITGDMVSKAKPDPDCFLLGARLLGVDITSMLAGLGIAGFAVSFAVQDMATDVIRGIGIIADSYCQVGDVILYKGMEAEVLTIGIRTTRVRILANDNIISIANRNISEVEVLSWKYVESFPMPYDLSIYQSEKVVRDIVNRISKNEFVENCKYVGVTELGSSAVYYNLEVRSDPMYRRQVRRDTLRSIMLGLEENHVPVPYNQLDVHMIDSKA